MFVHMWLPASRYADVARALSRLRATVTGHLCLTPLHTHHSKHLLDRAPLYLEHRGRESAVVRFTFEMVQGLKMIEDEAEDQAEEQADSTK
jgi:type II secretory ATPase GspE/PulE/Tfp pilus assembly ATPase PilB-like protein